MPKQKEQKMFEPQEKDPERLLSAGAANPVLKLIYILVINAVVFGVIYTVVYLLFEQNSANSKIAAETVTIITLIISLIFWVKNKNK
ncbi:MAG: hypothetical protein COT24_04120 [Candidatus Kerfeldbacteria bacterium CG08_land_8_20_14_0_20_40_16]|uniref:Uncharacterized protein n=1 Tax=Candidatus Kerfeldbacteria bacterium CG08_land_8_20_14_0_20_40_16 TaxID=2014244 RepID=A0A2H0YX65_9BACT|nr:MAG: hypothetical protein COT24_04120 [Candidatus Kerfeldbacteria bacterium CG08_land_8_20_14_0_20_40_16]